MPRKKEKSTDEIKRAEDREKYENKMQRRKAISRWVGILIALFAAISLIISAILPSLYF